MAVFENRRDVPAWLSAGAGVVAGETFPHVPAIVLPTLTAGWLAVDLLVLVLPYVGVVQVARLTIDAEAPGIAQTIGPDLSPRSGLTRKWVARRVGVGTAMIH